MLVSKITWIEVAGIYHQLTNLSLGIENLPPPNSMCEDCAVSATPDSSLVPHLLTAHHSGVGNINIDMMSWG